jgi:hypothetical protein
MVAELVFKISIDEFLCNYLLCYHVSLRSEILNGHTSKKGEIRLHAGVP